LADKKYSFIQGRLRPRLKELSLASYEDYLSFLKNNPQEVQAFFNQVTTNETLFFRTPRIWKYFQEEFLPTWYSSNKGGTLKIWSAASSSGEEAYTIAMICQEFKEKNLLFKYQIQGSDISTEVIEYAKKGIYDGRSLDNFKTNNLKYCEKYLDLSEKSGQVKSVLRDQVKFARQNLLEPIKNPETYDLVFLRNMLIYFTPGDQEKILENVRSKLNTSGTLVLGESESLMPLKTNYSFVMASIYKNGGVK
jgi:chemotaxis protein methyltransferase CheR